MKRLTYLVATPENPLALNTNHDGPLCPGSRMIVNGIRTRIEVANVRHGGLSSPVPPAPPARCDGKPLARKSRARCQLDAGHDGAHSFPA